MLSLILDITIPVYVQNLKTPVSAISKTCRKKTKRKIGVIWGDWDHSRSSVISPLDRAHTSFCSPLVETMRRSTVFVYSELFVARRRFFFCMLVYSASKNSTLRRRLRDNNIMFSRFDRTPTCVRSTDGRTDMAIALPR